MESVLRFDNVNDMLFLYTFVERRFRYSINHAAPKWVSIAQGYLNVEMEKKRKEREMAKMKKQFSVKKIEKQERRLKTPLSDITNITNLLERLNVGTGSFKTK